MDGSGRQFFSGSGLPCDNNVCIGSSGFSDKVVDFFHDHAFADEFI